VPCRRADSKVAAQGQAKPAENARFLHLIFRARRLLREPPEANCMLMPGVDRITSLLTEFLDVQSRRAELVASNLANADTPGYVAQELDFAEHLRRAAHEALAPANTTLTTTDGPRVVERKSSAVGLDGNTVDSGREMTTLAEAGMQFLAGAQMLQARLRTLRAAIREGR
jgi:flagellar basal-body rod protein FlgB